eukprot:2289943-Rhodomonas_salina.1
MMLLYDAMYDATVGREEGRPAKSLLWEVKGSFTQTVNVFCWACGIKEQQTLWCRDSEVRLLPLASTGVGRLICTLNCFKLLRPLANASYHFRQDTVLRFFSRQTLAAPKPGCCVRMLLCAIGCIVASVR